MKTAIHWADSAVEDIERLRAFLAKKNPSAARSAAQALIRATELLAENPKAGTPVLDMMDAGNYRDLTIPFGVTGYTLRYRYERTTVFILHFKHQKELMFKRHVP